MSLAETVIENDHRIDALAAELDELAITILARQQPVARDLRIVVSALRISASLERMGDMAEHIAQLARYRFPEKVVPKSLRSTFAEMGQLDVEIARKLNELLETQDLAIAEHIRNEDDKVDALHLQVFDKVLGEKWKGDTVDTVDATLASPLPRALRRPRGLDRQEGAVPRDRRLDPVGRVVRPALSRRSRSRFEAVDLAVELTGVARTDVGLQHQRDARSVVAHDIRGLFDDGEHLVPLALDRREHRVGAVGEARLADHPHGRRDRLVHRRVRVLASARGD